MRVIITGGSGYLGTHLRRFFTADDFSRRSNRDIFNPEDLAVISDYDAVIHLAARLDKQRDSAAETFRTNVEGTINVLRHVREGAAFIFASTKDVYGANADAFREVSETCPTDYRGQSPLEWSKLVAEHYVHYYAAARNFRACVFRLSTPYARPSGDNAPGFVTHYVESVKRGWLLRLPAQGRPLRDPLHVEDFSRACRAFIDADVERGVYNLGGGSANAITLRGIVETVGRLIEVEPVIDEEARIPAPAPFDYVSDISRARAELGWEPLIGIEEGLRSLV
ncbi:MAG TPA: NAD(P)-dependent oxidoreductase [Pyrinomonadaceae bacterium]|jgi:nucleoside-diphosphate-sugar epimerase|nr:NAD(P)-dependent oxidoreductase [Pyrinomonadaceae bacterium]